MVRILPLEDIARRRARGAIRTYLEGTRSLDSALDLIQGQEAYVRYLLAMEFSGYRDTRRYRGLREALERTLAEREGWADV